MTKILVAEDSRSIRESLADALGAEGYDIIEATNGRIALQKATEDSPDLVLMDLLMPDMGGLEALRHLREIAATESLPVIMMTSVPPNQGEPEATHWGAAHYISKPFEFDTLKAAIRSTLRKAASGQNDSLPIGTQGKLKPLEKLLMGGISRRTLTLIEGPTFSGKSTLCQHFVYGAVFGCCGVSYFASDHTTESLGARMRSLGMPVGAPVSSGKLVVNTLSRLDSDADSGEVMASLPRDITRLPSRYKVVVLDAITNLANRAPESSVREFCQAMKLLCREEKTVLLTADPGTLSRAVVQQLRDMCDTHLELTNHQVGERLLKNLSVRKANSTELTNEQALAFEVRKDLGIRFLSSPAPNPKATAASVS